MVRNAVVLFLIYLFIYFFSRGSCPGSALVAHFYLLRLPPCDSIVQLGSAGKDELCTKIPLPLTFCQFSLSLSLSLSLSALAQTAQRGYLSTSN